MTSHSLLKRQVEEHFGGDAPTSAAFRQFLEAIEKSYSRLQPGASVEAGEPARDRALRVVFDTMAAGVIVRDRDDRIIEHNRAAERILGLSFEQMRGQAAVDAGWKLVRPDGSDLADKDVPARQTIRDGRPRRGVLFGFAVPGGGVRLLSVDTEAVHDHAGRVIAAISTFSELPDTSRLQETAEPEASDAEPTGPRVTLAMIASRLGISTAAVSMALRGHRRISAKMQEKVRAVADELGYRPDPRLGRVMQQMRLRKRAAFKSVICALTDLPSLDGHYISGVIEAAAGRASRLGYGFAVEQIGPTADGCSKLARMLFSRGIDGLLLLPMSRPRDCGSLLEWNRYSIVAASSGVRRPEFDRVISDWSASVSGTYVAMAARGYRRIGAVINKAFDEVVGSRISSGIACAQWHLEIAAIETFYHCACVRTTPEVFPGLVRPRDCGGDSSKPWPYAEAVREWFSREDPDALVFDSEGMANVVLEALGQRVSETVGVAILVRPPGSRYNGWEENASGLGELAVDWLDQKIKAFEMGPPKTPSVRMVSGSWVDGASTRSTVLHQATLNRRCSALSHCVKAGGARCGSPSNGGTRRPNEAVGQG